MERMLVGVIGAGTMGRGIAQVAAEAGHEVLLNDSNPNQVGAALSKLESIFERLQQKGRVQESEARNILSRISGTHEIAAMAECGLVIEAIVEDLSIKKSLFGQLEEIVSTECVLATNTSSLSVSGIASGCAVPDRVVGMHFFNPAPLLPLVEVVGALQTSPAVVSRMLSLVEDWGKVGVKAKDTPGFIVNRVARPFYGEAIRIYEEGIGGIADIDTAMRTVGGFKMGPFELMDLIGNDINFAVTRSVFEAFYFDPRYKPSLTQQRMVDAGRLGRKSGRGYYTYADGTRVEEESIMSLERQKDIVDRIVGMLINEAADAVFWNVATPADIDLAMTKGVNYPRGLLEWADDLGIEVVLGRLQELFETYGEDRYRPSPLLRQMAKTGATFYG